MRCISWPTTFYVLLRPCVVDAIQPRLWPFHLALHDSPVSTGVDIQEEAMVLSDLTKAAQKLFKLQTTLRSSLLFATHLVGLVIPNSSTVLPPANRASEGLGRLQGLGQGRERPFRSTLPQLVPCRASLALTIHMPDSRNADPLPEIRRVLFSFSFFFFSNTCDFDTRSPTGALYPGGTIRLTLRALYCARYNPMVSPTRLRYFFPLVLPRTAYPRELPRRLVQAA